MSETLLQSISISLGFIFFALLGIFVVLGYGFMRIAAILESKGTPNDH